MSAKYSLETRLVLLFSVSVLLPLLPCIYIIWTQGYDFLESLTIILAFLIPSIWLFYRCYAYVTDVLERIGLQLDSLGNDEFNSWHLAGYTGGRINALKNDFAKLGSKLAGKRNEYLHNESFVFDLIKELELPILVLDHHDQVYTASRCFSELSQSSLNNLLGKKSSHFGLRLVNQQWQQVDSAPLNNRFEINAHVIKRNGRNYQLLVLFSIEQQLRDNEKQVWQRLIRVLNHEVRNSLTPIYSMSQSLQEMKLAGPLTAEQKVVEVNLLQVIEKRALQLLEFVENYSAFSKLPPAHKVQLTSSVINQRVQVLFPEVVIEAHKELSLMVDLGQLEQALINLIKNALEASAENTVVKLLWQERSRELEIVIIDSGTGITNPDNLFVPFYSTKESGSGIGLLLSRDLIRNQGGELSLKNRIDDVGAIAKVTLPIFEE